MGTINLYNIAKLVKVTINNACPARWWSWKPERKILGFTTQKAGYYDYVSGEWHGTEIPKYHQLIDGKLYENPEVILHYQANHCKTYYFDTYEQAQKFAEEVVSLGVFIE